MARFTPMLGSISGKIGDLVFANNRSGAYIRQKGLVINPMSQAQNQNRANFGLSSNLYHSLSNGAKALWNGFAPFYASKTGRVGSNASGFNVFVGMQATARNALRSLATATVKKNNTGAAVAGTFLTFAPTIIPPVGQLIATLNSDGGPIPIVVPAADITATITSAGVFNLSFAVNTTVLTVGQSFTTQAFKDTNNVNYGFQWEMSLGQQQAHNHVRDKDAILIGSMCGYTPTAPIMTATSLGIAITGTLAVADYDQFPSVGEVVEMSLWQVGQNGMCNKLQTKKITIT